MSGTLLIIAGQSNALGYGVTPAELPEGYAPDSHVQIWLGDHFEMMVPGVNTGTPANPTAWGPGVAFGTAWMQDHPGETLYVVEGVKGSTGLAADPTQLDWSPASSGELFDQTTAKVAAATAALGSGVHAVVYWDQGEQDAIDYGKAAAYGANLTDLEAHMFSAWGADEIAVARISAELAYANLVRAAQEASGRFVDLDGAPLQPDGLHLSGAGQLLSGDGAYAATLGHGQAVSLVGCDFGFHADWGDFR